MNEFDCLWCGARYEQPQARRSSLFCPPCRAQRNRQRDAERHRERRANPHAHRPATLAELAVPAEPVAPGDEAWAPDRMPRGASSPAGPDEGMTVARAADSVTLDRRARAAAAHPWWAAHPDWAVGLHDSDDAANADLSVA